MMIHKGLLTHDGVASNTAGKVIDLGFNGDFDIKNHAWNMVFVALPAATYYGGVTLTVETDNAPVWKGGTSYTQDVSFVKYEGNIYKCKTTNSDAAFTASKWTKLDLSGVQTNWEANNSGSPATYYLKKSLASLSISAADAGKGGVFGITIPKGLGRYLTLAIDGAKTGSSSGYLTVTAGVTDQVDTDVNPGVDWTYFKAETAGVNQPGLVEKEAEVIAAGPADSVATTIANAKVAAHAELTTGVHGLT